MTTPLESIAQALSELGPDYPTALSRLRATGLRGDPGFSAHCILAEYLTSRGCGSCSVAPLSRQVRYCPNFNFEGSVPLPEHLAALASDFDAGLLPDLEVRR